MSIEEYTEFLVKSICKESELVKVKSYENDDEKITLEILVPENLKGAVIGHDGKNIKAIRTLVNAYAYVNKKGYIELNIESF